MVLQRTHVRTIPILSVCLILVRLSTSSTVTINDTLPTTTQESIGEARSAAWKYPEVHPPVPLQIGQTYHGGRQYNDNSNNPSYQPQQQPDSISSVPGFPDALRPYPLLPYAAAGLSSGAGFNYSNSSSIYGSGHYPKTVQNVYYPIYVNDYKPKGNYPYFNQNKNPYPYAYPPKYPYQSTESFKGYPYPYYQNPQVDTYPIKGYPYPSIESYPPPKGYPYYPPYYPQQKPFYPNYPPSYGYNNQNIKIGYGSQLGYVQAMMSPDRGIKIEYIINPLLCYGLGMSACSGYIMKQKSMGQPIGATATPFKSA